MASLDYREKIVAMIEQQPVQPTQVAKELGKNSMLASAMLSEMSEKGLLKVSHLKVGSSPLYYHPQHPEHLLNFVQHLNEKDRRTVATLQEQGVMRDQGQDPLTRVSLRNARDFARPLDVTIDGNKELFWKFYLLTDEQAAERIKHGLQAMPDASSQPPEPQPEIPAQTKRQRKPRAKKPASVLQQTLEAPVAPAPTEASPQAVQPGPPASPPASDDPFLQQLMAFFASNSITVLEQVVLKKKSEYDFVVQLASPVGLLHYYCKAKNKAKVGEADLSHAYVQGQLKKLPVLFLASGTLTKPAQEFVKELKGLTVKQVA